MRNRTLEQRQDPNFGTLVAEIANSLPEERRFSLQVSAGLLTSSVAVLSSSVDIATGIMELGSILRLFLYSQVIEEFGDRLRKTDQIDAMSDLWRTLLERAVPLLGDVGDAWDALQKMPLIQNREEYVPESISQVQKLRDYLDRYAGLLRILAGPLESYANTLRSLSAPFGG